MCVWFNETFVLPAHFINEQDKANSLFLAKRHIPHLTSRLFGGK